jgi:prepilin-type N-terminal cleavage/methylation domain-containing protein
MKKNKFSSGFTLIELLVVIAIIGILGAIIYAPFQSARRKGRDAQRVIEMKNMLSSLHLYADSHNGYYPCDLNTLAAYQGEALPLKANTASYINNNNVFYNYVGYTDGRQDVEGHSGGACQYLVIGFHLWTHLETASGALDGAAKCWGFATTNNPNPIACISMPTFSNSLGQPGRVLSQTEPGDGTTLGTNAYSTTSRQVVYSGSTPIQGDADSICATQLNYCILDYHQ